MDAVMVNVIGAVVWLFSLLFCVLSCRVGYSVDWESLRWLLWLYSYGYGIWYSKSSRRIGCFGYGYVVVVALVILTRVINTEVRVAVVSIAVDVVSVSRVLKLRYWGLTSL